MSASATCPNGHVSETTDYCDQCGAPLESRPSMAPCDPGPPAASRTIEPEVSPDTTPSVPAEPCPDCGTPRVGSDKFCEDCGYSFFSGESAAAPARGSTPDQTETWSAVVEADRDYFERVAAEEIEFPSHYKARSFTLEEPEVGIGRNSPSRGIRPEIDLSGAPEDPAISHMHALLIRQEDGSYTIVDPGSSNGTTLNDDPVAISPNTPVTLADGDRIHLGAWTTITIRQGEM
jgi:FHA domain